MPTPLDQPHRKAANAVLTSRAPRGIDLPSYSVEHLDELDELGDEFDKNTIGGNDVCAAADDAWITCAGQCSDRMSPAVKLPEVPRHFDRLDLVSERDLLARSVFRFTGTGALRSSDKSRRHSLPIPLCRHTQLRGVVRRRTILSTFNLMLIMRNMVQCIITNVPG